MFKRPNKFTLFTTITQNLTYPRNRHGPHLRPSYPRQETPTMGPAKPTPTRRRAATLPRYKQLHLLYVSHTMTLINPLISTLRIRKQLFLFSHRRITWTELWPRDSCVYSDSTIWTRHERRGTWMSTPVCVCNVRAVPPGVWPILLYTPHTGCIFYICFTLFLFKAMLSEQKDFP